MIPPRDFALFNQQRKQPSPAARSRLLRLDCRHPEKPALAAAFDGRDECPVSFRQIAPPPRGEQRAKTSRFTGTVPSLPVFSVPRQASWPRHPRSSPLLHVLPSPTFFARTLTSPPLTASSESKMDEGFPPRSSAPCPSSTPRHPQIAEIGTHITRGQNTGTRGPTS